MKTLSGLMLALVLQVVDSLTRTKIEPHNSHLFKTELPENEDIVVVCPSESEYESTSCYATIEPPGCYCLIPVEATRDQAEQMCEEMGLQLVSIETAEENELIKEIFHATPIGQSGVRMWTSGTKERVDASRTPLLVLMLSLPPNELGLKEKIKEIIRQQEQDDYKFWTWSSTGTRLNYTDWRPDDHQITIGKDEYLALWYNIKGASGWKNIITPADDQPHFPLCEVPASVVAESLASLN